MTASSSVHLCVLVSLLISAVHVESVKTAPTPELTCFCNLCPNQTCQTNGVCMTQIIRQPEGEVLRSYSCLAKYQLFPLDNPFLCRTNEKIKDSHVIACCSRYDLCNKDSNVTLAESRSVSAGASFGTDGYLFYGLISFGLLVLIAFAFCAFVFLKKRQQSKFLVPKDENSRLLEEGLLKVDGTLSSLVGDFTTSGSGSGLPLLIQRTIARQVTLGPAIGKGRYGEVYLGRWHGESVAVKLFSSRDEDSWRREVEIYQTTMLRHENLLGFIAADNKDSGMTTQLWLITEYHELGSLFDFLTANPVDLQSMLRLTFSLVHGLSFLHMDIVGTSSLGKPSIAHRDLKSKNVLVKRNGQCAIADLGLAVRYQTNTGVVDIPQNDKVGTVRYLAPEVLDGALNLKHFESLKSVDIYACALVIWEICHRCQFNNGPAEDYELPYHRDVPGDPDVAQMRLIVSTLKKRPMIHNQWSIREPMRTMSRLMRECWYQNPQARLTALRLKKTIAQLIATEDVKI